MPIEIAIPTIDTMRLDTRRDSETAVSTIDWLTSTAVVHAAVVAA